MVKSTVGKKRSREGHRKITIYGKQPVNEALESEWPVYEIIVRKGQDGSQLESILAKARSSGISITYMDDRDFDAVYGKSAQGVAAVIGEVVFKDLDEVLGQVPSGEDPLFVALDGIEDPQNLGSICRTSHAMGVHAVVIPRRRTAPIAEGAFKASAGAVFYQPVCEVPNIHHFIQWCKKNGIWVYGLDADGPVSLWDMDLKGPIGLIIGSEGKGLSRLARERCDGLIKIPMFGKINSLNSSVACGMSLYEVQRQRNVRC